ncbi:MAG TPA: gamma-glutamylcyclotransferase [Rhodospirillaceae bacterium]|nr:gamma-glutamylcyclotransferase [Alphaproteobacteria bacterium]OUT41742.1 MAG: hypothetical protein CBB62_05335 [Micavibrio sp. TMED2]HCI45964.1 gamma-glutamylcyclotransferase [Rhodospirillaceae bacterium]MAS46679.1 gamma-glutamylcyclotransferase [Alphaproteobacteria bacterium]MAX94774.1 gamma-glutamylcyclotransferase [Alphaproteobacteria bacterium]|tara:strand:+ start:4896 stop:5537 length:642 start_codon:yes stop_codon:yes gene_type:complete
MVLERRVDDPFDRHFRPGEALEWLRSHGLAPENEDTPPYRPIWVFGYGSLMWNPGIRHDHAEMVLLRGYHRRFCVLSHRYRGTPERPGLVLGLDRGGACWGMAFRIPAEHVAECAEYLWYREMISEVYKPTLISLNLRDGPQRAVTFRVRRDHHQYYPGHDLDEVADIIARSVGPRGANVEYLDQTVCHLRQMKIRDPQLETLWHSVQGIRSG